MALLTAADFTAIVLADALKAIALALSDDAVDASTGIASVSSLLGR